MRAKKNLQALTSNEETEQRGKAFKKFAFALAWINFLAIVGVAVYDALKGHEPPEKDDYYK